MSESNLPASPLATVRDSNPDSNTHYLSITFDDGYAIRKIIEYMSTVAQESKMYFSRDYIQCYCESMHADENGNRRHVLFLCLASQFASGKYVYNFPQDEVYIDLNLVDIYKKLSSVKVKIGRVKIIKDSLGSRILTINSLSDSESWTDSKIVCSDIERISTTVDDYTVAPIAISKASDFTRICKDSKGCSLSFSVHPSGCGLIVKIKNKDKYVQGKVIGEVPSPVTSRDDLKLSVERGTSSSASQGPPPVVKVPSLSTMDASLDLSKTGTPLPAPIMSLENVDQKDPIVVGPNIVEKLGKLTGLGDSKIYWNLDDSKPLKIAYAMNWGWLVTYII